MSKPVFVYGTLKVGGYFSLGFDSVRKDSKVATLKGYDLYDLGWFPGIVKGNGQVVGELHDYERFNEVIQELDRIEGYSAVNEKNSLFLRKEVEVELENGEVVTAIAYVFNNQPTSLAKKIDSGVWDI